MISVCIPIKNDFEAIVGVVDHLAKSLNPQEDEIIIYNDGSKHTNTRPRFLENNFNYQPISIINSATPYGVGYAFDRCVEKSKNDFIVIMGADVFPLDGWYEKVHEAVSQRQYTIGCATCIGDKRYHGAELLFTVGVDDLPVKSGLRDVRNYSELFKGRWVLANNETEPYKIPCLMGAFYWTTKSYYNYIGGWDTIAGNKWRGHKRWGHLEPYLSLKSWLVGGGVTLYPTIEARHIFTRFSREKGTKWMGGVRGEDFRYWNQLFILETQILDEGLRQKLYSFLKPRLNLGVAKKWIKQHYSEVLAVREANRQRFVNTPEIFTEKFNISLKYEKE